MTGLYVRSFHTLSLLLTSLLIGLTTFPLLAQPIRYVKPTATGLGDGSSWTNASGNLQAIIDASALGVQVWVAAGTYKPTTGIDRTASFNMKTGVFIYGGFAGNETNLSQRPAINATTPSSSTLSGDIGTVGNNADNSYHVINNFASLSLNTTAILDGFVITGGNANGASFPDNAGGAIYNNGRGFGNVCNPRIRFCLIVNNSASSLAGGVLNDGFQGTSRPLMQNCLFQNNSAAQGGAIYNAGSQGVSSLTLVNSAFLNNTASSQGGALYNDGYNGGTSRPELTNCSFQGNTSAEGGAAYNFASEGAVRLSLNSCVLFGNGGSNTFVSNAASATIAASYSLFDDSVMGYTNPIGSGNVTILISPFSNANSTQLRVGSPAINVGDPAATTTVVGTTDLGGNPRFSGGRIDMGAYESCTPTTRLYVRASATGLSNGSSWADAFPDLQSALTYPCSQSLTEIWVAQGTYKPTPTIARTISFAMKNGIAIYGGFVGNEANLSGRPPITATTPSSTTLSGDIGMVGNTSDNSYHVISNPAGLTTTAILDGFVITAGNADSFSEPNNLGGGMLNNGGGSGNVCSPLIRQCMFVANRATYGGAIDNEGYTGGNSSPVLINCYFQGNIAINRGGVMYNYGEGGTSSPILTNCSFQSNTAFIDGGAIYNNGQGGTSSPVLTNCSFQNNGASNSGGVMYNLGTSSPVLTNCVLWNNGEANTVVNENATVMANYSLFDASVRGYISGPGCLTVTTSPFASPTSTQLAPTSRAINTGDPASTTSTGAPAAVGTTDLGGTPRFAQGRIDMGAFEWGTTCQGLVTSLKAGNWNDPTVWACNVVPISTDIVQLNHVVTLPVNHVAPIKTLRNSATGKVKYQSGAKLKLGF